MWHSRPPRDPPPFMAKTILNFHFDYWNPSLIFLHALNVDSIKIILLIKFILILTKLSGP